MKSLILTLTLTSFPSTASSSRSWTGREYSPSLLSLEQQRSPWTTQDFVEGSPTGSFWRRTRRTLSRPFGPEIPLADLGPPTVSVPSACCARLLSSFGGIREEDKLCKFSSTLLLQPIIHSCCYEGLSKKGTSLERYIHRIISIFKVPVIHISHSFYVMKILLNTFSVRSSFKLAKVFWHKMPLGANALPNIYIITG